MSNISAANQVARKKRSWLSLTHFMGCPSLCHLPTGPTHVDDDRIQAIVDAA
jgi:hypothetical protein